MVVHVRLLLGLLAAAVLGGCVNVDLELWVEPDGSGRSVTRLAPSASANPLFKQFAGQEVSRQMREQATRTEALLKEDANVARFAYREEAADGGTPTAYVYEVEVKDMTRLDETMARLRQELAADAEADADTRRLLEGTRAPEVARLDNGNYRFSASFGGEALARAGGAADRREDSNPFARLGEAIGRAVVGQVFQDATLSVRLHGAEVLSGNGQLSEDKRTMAWRMSLGELVAPGAPRVLEAEVRGASPLLIWAALLGVPLAVLGLALLAARRRRR